MDDLARLVVERLKQTGKSLACAESCTGGLLSAAITDISGSSEIFGLGIVSYSNQAKENILGVDPQTLAQYGAVSEEVAKQMAEAILIKASSSIGVSITGIAGPGGATKDKPVGMVCFGLSYLKNDSLIVSAHTNYYGDMGRSSVREASVSHALRMVLSLMDEEEA